MKKGNKIIFCVLVIIIIILCCIIVKLLDNKNEKVNVQNVSDDQNYDEEVPENIEISIENQIYCAMILSEFNNGKELSIDDYLNVVKNSLANGYVNIDNEDNTYTEQQIKSIIYSIFGVSVSENKSIDGLAYEKGEYILSQDRFDYIYELKDSYSDVAAGTAYFNFKLYKEFSSGEEEFIGSYSAQFSQNTVTGDRYIYSIKSVE